MHHGDMTLGPKGDELRANAWRQRTMSSDGPRAWAAVEQGWPREGRDVCMQASLFRGSELAEVTLMPKKGRQRAVRSSVRGRG